MSQKSSDKLHRKETRHKAIKLLGGKCIKCGFDDIRALQIDHINGGGGKEIIKYGSNHIARKIVAGQIGEYQLLCANCNWIKRVENNEVRGPR